MNRFTRWTAVAVVLLCPALAVADQVTCESNDSKQVECPLDTRGDVRVVRQMSKSPCVEGDSWGQSRRGIWVKDGCRAVFESSGRDDGKRGGWDDGRGRDDHGGRDDRGYDDGRGGRDDRGRDDGRDGHGDRDGRDDDRYRDGGPAVEVTCESKDNRQVECDIGTRGDVRLVRQLSKSACVEGRSWGQSRHAVWVKDGCRAVFATGGNHR